VPDEPIIGAAAVHCLLKGRRTILSDRTAGLTSASLARD
jgi:hypothetical protein